MEAKGARTRSGWWSGGFGGWVVLPYSGADRPTPNRLPCTANRRSPASRPAPDWFVLAGLIRIGIGLVLGGSGWLGLGVGLGVDSCGLVGWWFAQALPAGRKRPHGAQAGSVRGWKVAGGVVVRPPPLRSLKWILCVPSFTSLISVRSFISSHSRPRGEGAG